MFNPVAVWAKHTCVRQYVQSTGCLGVLVMNITSSRAPSADLALIAKFTDGSLCPRMTGFVATLSSVDRVRLPFIPNAVPPTLRFVGLGSQATARFSAGRSGQVVRLNDLLVAAVADATPHCAAFTIAPDAFKRDQLAISMPLKITDEAAQTCRFDPGADGQIPHTTPHHMDKARKTVSQMRVTPRGLMP